MDRTPPLVSIGLPVFNGEQYLPEAIDAVLAQDFDDFELIISDNASTDGTEEICRRYAAQDARISYHRQEKNLGASRNYNYVFEVSSGAYFHWAAHDDIMLPGFLTACLREFDRRKNDPVQPSIVLPRGEIINAVGEVTGPDLTIEALNPRTSARVYTIVRSMGAVAVFGLLRREDLAGTRLIGPFLSSDFNLLLEMAMLGTIVQIDDLQFQRRVHSGMSTKTNRNDRTLLAWFDPSARAKRFDKYKHYLEYFRSIWRVGTLPVVERIECTLVLVPAVAAELVRRLRVFQGRHRRRIAAFFSSP